MPGAAQQLLVLFEAECYPHGFGQASKEAVMELYAAWWKRQTAPAVHLLTDRAQNEALPAVYGEGWTEAN